MKYQIKHSIITLTLLLLFLSCQESFDRKIVNSDNGDYSLTILKTDGKIFLINGDYKSDRKPQNGFIENNGGLEYYSGLINWTENATKIYTTYGIYDTTKTKTKIKLIKVSTSEFEKLKKDSLKYKYFYY